jgi:hypothetical protein
VGSEAEAQKLVVMACKMNYQREYFAPETVVGGSRKKKP